MSIHLSVEDNFSFKGFNPTSDLRWYCKQVYCRVENRSPSEASKVAFVIKTKNGYEGLIRVVSASGTFMVTSSKTKPTHLIDDLYSQFSQKISMWSQERNLRHRDLTR